MLEKLLPRKAMRRLLFVVLTSFNGSLAVMQLYFAGLSSEAKNLSSTVLNE